MNQKGLTPVLVLLIIALIGAGLFGAYYLGAQRNKNQNTQIQITPTPTPQRDQAEEECRARGGEWKQIGLDYKCEINHTDGGKTCSDNSECQGTCLAPEGVKPGEDIGAKGNCSSYSPVVGCFSSLNKGTVSLTICAD